MYIDDLRKLKHSLKHRMNCPPDAPFEHRMNCPPDAPFSEFLIKRSAPNAGDQYDELAPVFALLEELDRLAKRVEQLELLQPVPANSVDQVLDRLAKRVERLKRRTRFHG